MAAEESEVRALVLARTLQGRMVRAAHGLHESAIQAAELCERRAELDQGTADAADWEERGKHWRLAAERALDVVIEWDSAPQFPRSQLIGHATAQLHDWVVPVLSNAVRQLQDIHEADESALGRVQSVVGDVELTVRQLIRIIAELRD